MSGIYTCYQDNNDFLFKELAPLYFKEGDKIADVTFGKGVFWKKLDTLKYDFNPSDLLTVPEHPYNFKDLPYCDDDFDVVIFDPPYAHNPGNMIINDSYKNKETTKGFYHDDIIQLYREGMTEAYRILKKNGYLFVKCKDEIESSKQRRSQIEIWHIALDELKMTDKDLFVLRQKVNPVIQYKNQKHARKNHSYLWVFKK